jgi:tetratricopeptide (TPR) repeat protein
LNVEAVAWISEMKGLLCSLFYLLAMICYVKYIKNHRINKAYYLTMLFFILALLSKPMAISLPLMLLLIDYYFKRRPDKIRIIDKVPFFVLSFAFGIIAILAQYSANAVRQESIFNLANKLMIASRCLVFYLNKILIPSRLSCMYSYYGKIGSPALPLEFFFSPFIIVILVLLVFLSKKYTEKLFFGSLFFLFSILPALQFVPISPSMFADRYVYIASIGIFYILAEGFVWFYRIKIRYSRQIRTLILVVLMVIASILFFLTQKRCQVWRDSISLWSDNISHSPNVSVAYYNRGVAYRAKGNLTQVISDYNRAIGFNPEFSFLYINRGAAYQAQGNLTQAISDFNQAIQINPNYAEAYNNRGVAYRAKGNLTQAISDFNQAIQLNPNYSVAYYNRALAYFKRGEYDLGWRDVRAAEALGYKVDIEFRGELRKIAGEER